MHGCLGSLGGSWSTRGCGRALDLLAAPHAGDERRGERERQRAIARRRKCTRGVARTKWMQREFLMKQLATGNNIEKMKKHEKSELHQKT